MLIYSLKMLIWLFLWLCNWLFLPLSQAHPHPRKKWWLFCCCLSACSAGKWGPFFRGGGGGGQLKILVPPYENPSPPRAPPRKILTIRHWQIIGWWITLAYLKSTMPINVVHLVPIFWSRKPPNSMPGPWANFIIPRINDTVYMSRMKK